MPLDLPCHPWVAVCASAAGVTLPPARGQKTVAHHNFEALRHIGAELLRRRVPLWRRLFTNELRLASHYFAVQVSLAIGLSVVFPRDKAKATKQTDRRARLVAMQVAATVLEDIPPFLTQEAEAYLPPAEQRAVQQPGRTGRSRTLMPFPFDRRNLWKPPPGR